MGQCHNGKWEFAKRSATLYSAQNVAIITAQLHNGLFIIQASDLAFANLAEANGQDTRQVLKDWHDRLGHLNVNGVIRLARDGKSKAGTSITP